MRRFLAPFASVIVAIALVGWVSVYAQTIKFVVSQGSDGTLYVVTDHGRFTLVPVRISDDELNASVDLGAIDGGQLALAFSSPTDTPVPPAAVPPTDTPVSALWAASNVARLVTARPCPTSWRCSKTWSPTSGTVIRSAAASPEL
jgi:hypothetical protein